MKRATFPYVVLVLLVFVWSLPILGWATCSEQHKEEKGEQKACSLEKGDHKEGEHAKEHSMATWAEKKQKKGGAIECLETLKAKLQLEDEQVAKIKALLEAKKEGLKATMGELKETEAPKEEFNKAIQEASTEFEANLAEILTADQTAKYEELKSSFKKWKTKKSGEACEKKDPLAGLNLTEDQKAKFNEITERYHEMQKELYKQMQEDLNEVLTPEQIEEFQAMKKHHKMGESKASEAVE